MNFILQTVFKCLFLILYGTFAIVYDIVKFFIPHKYRAKRVDKDIVLVTGSGSGLGRSLAKKFANLGATIVLLDVNTSANMETLKQITDNGGKAHAFKCNLSDKDEIYAVAERIQSTIGNITILINNAGIVTGKKFLDSADFEIEKTFQVNLMAHFWTTKSFLPNMLNENRGHIVTIASMAGILGTAGLCDYSASKFGAVGFDDALRNELYKQGKTGVKTTLVCPYYINTGMFDGVVSRIIPILDAEYVTDKIVEATLINQEVLMLPRFMYLAAFLQRLVPVRISGYISNNIFESCNSMNSFVGRSKTD